MATAGMTRLGLIVSQFNRPITTAMEAAAEEAAVAVDAEIATRVSVPGVYDTPLAAQRVARAGEVDAIAVIGTVITGETDHDQVIATAAATALSQVSLETDTPVTFGVSGPGMTTEQARARIDRGADAVTAAVAMVGAGA
jgi:6,7-dimethyl-8-ribityllumazine synthase